MDLGFIHRTQEFNSTFFRGQPNIIFVDGVLNILERFVLVAEGSSAVALSAGNPINDKDFWRLHSWYTKFQQIMKSATGSHNQVSPGQIVDYLKRVGRLMSVVQTILGLKALYDLDWENVLGEERPEELYYLGRDAELSDAAFDDRYGALLARCSMHLAPITMSRLYALFHSPYTMDDSSGAVFINVYDVEDVIASNAAALLSTELASQLSVLGGQSYMDTNNALHSFTNWSAPIQPSVFVPESMLHTVGFINMRFETTNDATSIFETDARDICVGYLNASDIKTADSLRPRHMIFNDEEAITNATVPTMRLALKDDGHDHSKFTFVPFYAKDPDSVAHVNDLTVVCYNHGLANYGRFATIDSAGVTLHVNNLTANIGTSDPDRWFLEILGKAWQRATTAFLSVEGEFDYWKLRPEDYLLTVHNEAIHGFMFDKLFDTLEEADMLDTLGELTKLSGPKAPSKPVADIKSKI